MGRWENSYPEISNLLNMKPTPRILLGQKLFWTYKMDGSNICIWLEDGEVKISSRRMKEASDDLKALVKRTEEYKKIIELLRENPFFIVYVEACKKGRSVTKIELYERDTLFMFDIYDREKEKFLYYVVVYQHGYHYKIPVVELYAETKHNSIKDLLRFKKKALEYCKENNIEGMVIKAYKIPEEIKNWRQVKHGLLQAKVKLDIPIPKVRKSSRKEPIYPPIPRVEIMGAIDKVWQELGNEDFRDIKKAMPLVARAVAEECKKHLYSNSKQKLFVFYQEYLENRINE